MKQFVRCAAAAVATLVVAGAAPPSVALAQPTSQPRDEEWWFASWGVRDRIWPLSTGKGITVAVVDSGVNARLPELRDVVVAGTDASGQGHGDGRVDIDDGKNLGGEKVAPAGHGTGMAALIAGQGGPARMVGVAPDAKIMPIVSDGYSTTFAAAFRYAADHDVQVINVSQGAHDPLAKAGRECDPDLQRAIAYAVEKDVVIVAGAGNNGAITDTNLPDFPASCPGVLAVGAVDNKKRAWPKTQRQAYVAVSAPGSGVGTIDKRGTFNDTVSGTSQAAALTSAAVALLRAKEPDLSAREVVQRIINTTVDAGPPGKDDQTGAGVVLPPVALTKTVDSNAPNPPFERLDEWLATHPPDQDSETPAPQPAPIAGAAEAKAPSSVGLIRPALAIVVLGGVAFLAVRLIRRRRRSKYQ